MKGVAKDVLGAAEDGGVNVFIVARVIFQRRNPRRSYALRQPTQFKLLEHHLQPTPPLTGQGGPVARTALCTPGSKS